VLDGDCRNLQIMRPDALAYNRLAGLASVQALNRQLDGNSPQANHSVQTQGRQQPAESE
jgi:hypothetical protein